MEISIDPQKFDSKAEELYQKALEDTIALLKNCKTGRYIVVPNWDDEVDTRDLNGVPIAIWAIGLSSDEHICVKAWVMDVGYGYCEEDFPDDWVDIVEHKIESSCYPELYRFVAENLDKATSKEEADKIKWD